MPLESCGRCGRWPRQEKCDPIPGSQTTLGRCWSHKIPATSPSEAMSGSHAAQNEVFMTWCWGTHWLRWRKAKKNSKTCEGKTFSCNRGCKYVVEQEQISTWRIVVRRMFWQVHCVVSVRRTRVMNVKGTMPLGCAMSYFMQSVEWKGPLTIDDLHWRAFSLVYTCVIRCIRNLDRWNSYFIRVEADGILGLSKHSEQSYELTQGDSDISCTGGWWLSEQAEQILCSNPF